MTKESQTVVRQRKADIYKKYENLLHNFASDTDITRALNCDMKKIIKYSELSNYTCFSQLLPNEQDFIVLLIEQK